MFSPPTISSLIAQIVFFAAIAMILYTYIGYPLTIFAISRLIPRTRSRSEILPRISMIIAAYNEERDIAAKLENALSLDYPSNLLEIIVASDCSQDMTDEIVRGFEPQGVILKRQNERHGKTRAQNRAVSASTGDILVFSDATTMYEKDSLKKIVRCFAEPTVGCVAGQLIYVDGSASAVGEGCRSYWSYEKLLKSWESQVGSLIGVSGCMYAVRRSCHAKMASDMIDDFVIATEIHLQGLRTIYEPEAICTEDTNHRVRDEFKMRVRVIEQTLRALYGYREALSLRKHGMYAFQLICHKILRYSIPFLLMAAFVANLFALGAGVFYQITFGLQCIAYLIALLGWAGDRRGVKMGPAAIPYYFMVVNVAVLAAVLKFLRGESHVVWDPVRDARQSKAAT